MMLIADRGDNESVEQVQTNIAAEQVKRRIAVHGKRFERETIIIETGEVALTTNLGLIDLQSFFAVAEGVVIHIEQFSGC